MHFYNHGYISQWKHILRMVLIMHNNMAAGVGSGPPRDPELNKWKKLDGRMD